MERPILHITSEADFKPLKMKAKSLFETSREIYPAARRHIQKIGIHFEGCVKD